MKYIVLLVAVVFGMNTTYAQIDKINAAKEKGQKEVSKGENKVQSQKETAKEEISKGKDSMTKEISKVEKAGTDAVKDAAGSEAENLAKMSREDISAKMKDMTQEEKVAFKEKVNNARAGIKGKKDDMKEMSNKVSNMSDKGRDAYKKNIDSGRADLMKKHGKSKSDIAKMEGMSENEVEKLPAVEKAQVKEVKTNSMLSASEGKVLSANDKIDAARKKLDAAKADGSKTDEEIKTLEAKIEKATAKVLSLKETVVKGRSMMK